MKLNLYKKVLGLVLGAALAGAIGVAAQSSTTDTNSAKTEQQTAANNQNGQDKQSCPMMKDMKMENMDMSKMKDMDMSKMDMSKMDISKMKETKMQNMNMSEMKDMKMGNMKMSEMMENCKKMGGMNGGGSTGNKKSDQ